MNESAPYRGISSATRFPYALDTDSKPRMLRHSAVSRDRLALKPVGIQSASL
jgi:hypothetical protein